MAAPATLESCLEDECGGLKFDPPVYKQRYSAVAELAQKLQAKKVVDMGCAECKLVRQLRRKQFIEELVGVDVDAILLQLCENIVQPLITDFLVPRPNPLVMRLMQGSIADPDRRLLNFDLLACVEVIEHLDPPVLDRVPESVFGVLRPKVVAMTTPNAEFNVLFPGFSGFRHADHRFEWTRKEFQLWGLGVRPSHAQTSMLECSRVCERYPYCVEFSGVGEPPAGMEHVGYCSQMAVFTRLDAPSGMSQELKTDAKGIGMPYKIIAECVHPHEEHPLSLKEKLCHEAEYYLNLLLQQKLETEDAEYDTNYPSGGSCDLIKPPPVHVHVGSTGPVSDEASALFCNRDSKDETCGTESLHTCSDNILVGLEELFKFPKIKNLCSTADEIRSALQLSHTVRLDATGRYAAFDYPESETESDSSSETDPDNQSVVYVDHSTTCCTGQPDHLQMATPFSLEPGDCWD